MAKAPAKKTPAKKPAAKPRKAEAKTAAPIDANDDAASAVKKTAKRKTAPKVAKTPADTRIVTMHGETRLTHRGDGAEALAALIPAIDAVHAGDKVVITSAVHDGAVVHIHAVPAGHALPYETNPGVVLTIGANGLMAFDHVAIGLATPDSIEEAVLSVMDAVRPVDGEAPGPVGRRTDWHPQALLAAQTLAERLGA
ncbi:MAG: hypothetical protein K2Y02_06510 [Burkholderiaceae bacterium]|nr:hypothetical protein [Burkholderiaceae bacterium]